MYMDNSAIVRNVLANFVELGVQQENIGFANVTMQSENFVCVRESRQSARSAVKILDLRKGIEISEKPVSADSIIMNPKSTHMALRAMGAIQIFDLDSKAKIASCSVDYEIIFWSWLNERTLAIVSNEFVYKWSYLQEPDSEPEVWFEKSDALDECQIINIQCDHTVRWCLLTGIQLKNGRITGTIQLFNQEKQLSQMIEGHAGCFLNLSSPNASKPYSLLAFASRTSSELKIQIVEIDHPEELPIFVKRVLDLPTAGMSENDFPINILFDSTTSTIMIYTKFGSFFLIEPRTAKLMYSEKFSESPIYLICPSQDRSCHFIMNRKGDLIKCSPDAKQLLKLSLGKGYQYLQSSAQIANSLSTEGQKEIYRNYFDELKNSGKHLEALQLVAKAGKSFLRSFEYMAMIKEFPQVNNTNALLEYFALILQDGSLNEAESIELAQLALKKSKLELLRKWASDGKIHFSSHLGTLILEADTKLALEVFLALDDELNAALAFSILNQFDDQFKELMMGSQKINLTRIFDYLSKQHKDSCVKLIDFLIREIPSIITEDFISFVLNTDLESFNSDLVALLGHHQELFANFSGSLIASFVQRLCKSHPEGLLEFLNSSTAGKLNDTEALFEQLIEAKQFSAAFCVVRDMRSALELIENHSEIGTVNYKYLKLPHKELIELIDHLLGQEEKQLHLFCAVLGRFVEESSFSMVKNSLSEKLTDSEILGFLTFWSSKIKSDAIAHELLRSNLKLKQHDQVENICTQVEFSEPRVAFDLLKTQDYKCNGLVILARRYHLEAELISTFADNNDETALSEFINTIGIDAFISLLPVLIKSGIAEDLISPHLKAPNDKDIVLRVADELEQQGHLQILSGILKTCEWKDDADILLFSAKLLCLQSDVKGFCEFLATEQGKKISSSALVYAEEKCPKAALTFYRSNSLFQNFIDLSIKLEDWESLSKFLIEAKDKALWFRCLKGDCSSAIFEATISNCIHFSDSESASVLVKNLVELGGSEERLVRLTEALLSENPKFKASRSLQTLHLLHLIPLGDDERTMRAINSLDSYSVEEVVKASVGSNRIDMALCILERFELWSFAFKTAFFILKDINKALQISEKWNNPEAFGLIFQHYLLAKDAPNCLKFYSKMTRLDFKAKELIHILKEKSLHRELYDYLCKLREKGLMQADLERAMFDCLVELDRMNELEEFVSSAAPSTAAELGFSLARGKKFHLAGEAFIRAGDFDRAVKCFLHTDQVHKVFEYSLKSKILNTWVKAIKLALKQKQFDTAQKLALKCLESQPQSAQIIFSIYNEFGAFVELIEVLQTFISLSSSPNRDTLIALGSMYARYQQSSLDAFLTKFHSMLPVTFVNVLAEHRLWKESFNFFILAGDVDRALQVVIGHPSVTLDAKKMAAILPRVKNASLLSKLLAFYCEYDPDRLVQLKGDLIACLGIGEIVNVLRERKLLFIVEDEIKKAPTATSASIDLFIDSNDYYGLLEAIKKDSTVLDLTAISAQLAQSPHRHFRVLSGKLAASAGNHRAALKTLLKEDAIVECLLVLSQTGNMAYCEAFFSKFARTNNAVMFMAIAYILFDSMRPDILFEWTQRTSFQQLALPLYCQLLRNRFK